MSPTGTAPISGATTSQSSTQQLHPHHSSPTPNLTSTQVQQRNVHPERQRRPGVVPPNGSPHSHTDPRPKQQHHHHVPEVLHSDIISGHRDDHSNLAPPPPPPSIVDQLHKDIPNPGKLSKIMHIIDDNLY